MFIVLWRYCIHHPYLTPLQLKKKKPWAYAARQILTLSLYMERCCTTDECLRPIWEYMLRWNIFILWNGPCNKTEPHEQRSPQSIFPAFISGLWMLDRREHFFPQLCFRSGPTHYFLIKRCIFRHIQTKPVLTGGNVHASTKVNVFMWKTKRHITLEQLSAGYW